MAEDIHPTALIDPVARLGARVRVGAYTIVGPEAVIGDDVELGHHVVLEGRVELADRVRVGHGTVLGGMPQDLKFKPDTPSGVRIGAGTTLREYVTVHRATSPDGWTEIGRDCLIMGLAHVAHDCRLADAVIVINYAGITGHCQIGDRVIVGGMVGMAPFTRIGTGAYVGGMAKVTADVPPYMLVEGQPAVARGVNVVGLRRTGMAAAERRVLRDAYRILYRSGLAPHRALERLREELPACPPLRTLIDFIAGATRLGICKGSREALESAGEAEEVTS